MGLRRQNVILVPMNQVVQLPQPGGSRPLFVQLRWGDRADPHMSARINASSVPPQCWLHTHDMLLLRLAVVLTLVVLAACASQTAQRGIAAPESPSVRDRRAFENCTQNSWRRARHRMYAARPHEDRRGLRPHAATQERHGRPRPDRNLQTKLGRDEQPGVMSSASRPTYLLRLRREHPNDLHMECRAGCSE